MKVFHNLTKLVFKALTWLNFLKKRSHDPLTCKTILLVPLSAYCQQLEDMVDEKIEAWSALRAKAKKFRHTLNDEEAKSRMLQMPKN